MHRSSITLSVLLHVAIFIIATLGLPFLSKHEFEVPPPIVVDYIEVAKVTETNKLVTQPAPKPEKELPKAEPKPAPAAKNTSNEAVVPIPKDMIKPEDKTPKKEAKADPLDPNAPPDKKKKIKEKEEEVKKEPPKDFSSVLKNLIDTKDTPVKTVDPNLKSKQKAQPEFGQDAPLGAKLTMSEVDALRSQLERCWNVPFGAKDVENMNVDIFMVINPDRTLREARIVDQIRYNSDSFFRAAADSALRAVRSPLCSPFNLPPDKYDTWNRVTVTFNPKNMF